MKEDKRQDILEGEETPMAENPFQKENNALEEEEVDTQEKTKKSPESIFDFLDIIDIQIRKLTGLIRLLRFVEIEAGGDLADAAFAMEDFADSINEANQNLWKLCRVKNLLHVTRPKL